MYTLTFTATTAALLLGTTALAATVDDVIAQLEAEGFTEIEVEVDGNLTIIEGENGDEEREVVLDTTSGAIISDEIEIEDEDDEDEDEDEDEDDEDDEDEDDEDDEDEDDEDEDDEDDEDDNG